MGKRAAKRRSNKKTVVKKITGNAPLLPQVHPMDIDGNYWVTGIYQTTVGGEIKIAEPFRVSRFLGKTKVDNLTFDDPEYWYANAFLADHLEIYGFVTRGDCETWYNALSFHNDGLSKLTGAGISLIME